MQKTYFHNNKSLNENKDKNKLIQTPKGEIKSIVDINILLNRVKINKKDMIKRKIIFFSFVLLSVSLFGTFLATINN
tara:strand:- start:284 stop:514 length:231 start_codon:yes stop_codon:yes gene_type:complete